MSTTEITLVYNEEFSKEEKELIGQILRDALGEFRSARTSIKEYVCKRYDYLSEAGQKMKMKQVEDRLNVAYKLNLFDIEIK